MLITPSNENNVFTLKPLEAGQGIAGQGGVSATEVRFVVDVIKRRGEGVSHRLETGSAVQTGPLRRPGGPAPRSDPNQRLTALR